MRFEDLEYRLLLNADPVINWEPPAALNSYASVDSVSERFSYPQLATDSFGHWVAVWSSTINLDGTIGDDSDIFYSRSEDNGLSWSQAAPLNNNAETGSGTDKNAQVVTDSAGTWIATWHSTDNLDGTIGDDRDILFSCSTDNGQSWSDPAPLNTNADTDSGSDSYPQLATDSAGNWVAVWYSYDTLGETIGDDGDILYSASADNGQSWSDPVPLNTNADTDSGTDYFPQLATDSEGNWIAIWWSFDTLGDTIVSGTISEARPQPSSGRRRIRRH